MQARIGIAFRRGAVKVSFITIFGSPFAGLAGISAIQGTGARRCAQGSDRLIRLPFTKDDTGLREQRGERCRAGEVTV